MRNVTITLDEEVARWARILAAEKDTSVSKLVGEMLREKMIEDKLYQTSMSEYLSQKPRRLKNPKDKYPKREDLYGERGLR